MPAHSFGPEWLNPLLRGDKRGTTRPHHTRVKVGDIVSIYNQQRTSQRNRGRIQKIKVAGKRTNTCFRCGKFKIVYYLLGDEDRAAEKFIKVNAETLGKLNLSTNNALDSGLHRDMAQRIRKLLLI